VRGHDTRRYGRHRQGEAPGTFVEPVSKGRRRQRAAHEVAPGEVAAPLAQQGKAGLVLHPSAVTSSPRLWPRSEVGLADPEPGMHQGEVVAGAGTAATGHRAHVLGDGLLQALGARSGPGTDVQVAATGLWFDAVLGRNLLTSVTVRATKAKQFGLPGYSGDRSDAYSLQPEGALGLFLTDWLVAGAEYGARPDNLSVFEEEDTWSA